MNRRNNLPRRSTRRGRLARLDIRIAAHERMMEEHPPKPFGYHKPGSEKKS